MSEASYLGKYTMHEGDKVALTFVAANRPDLVFTAVSQKLVNSPAGASDLSTYYTSTPSYSGNSLISALIGVGASLTAPAGQYRLFLTGTYDGGLVHTWYWDIDINPKVGP